MPTGDWQQFRLEVFLKLNIALTWGRRGKSEAERLMKKSHSSLHCTMVQMPKIAVRVMV